MEAATVITHLNPDEPVHVALDIISSGFGAISAIQAKDDYESTELAAAQVLLRDASMKIIHLNHRRREQGI